MIQTTISSECHLTSFYFVRNEKGVTIDETGSKEFLQIADCSGPTTNKNQVATRKIAILWYLLDIISIEDSKYIL